MGESKRISEQGAAGHQNVCSGSRSTRHRRWADATVDFDMHPVAQPGRVDHVAHLADLALHRRDVALASEAGIDRHHEYQIDQIEHMRHR